jgi:transcriptional regulator with XRE-family HTH domain
VKLEEAIKRAGLNQSTCAKAAGMAPTIMWRYASGRHKPNVRNAMRIARVLGVDLEDIDEFEHAREEAEVLGVTEDVMTRRVLFEGREVYVLGDDTPEAIKQAFRAFAHQNPEQVKKLTPAQAAAIADSPELESKPLPITISKEE